MERELKAASNWLAFGGGFGGGVGLSFYVTSSIRVSTPYEQERQTHLERIDKLEQKIFKLLGFPFQIR
jgi:hypothetical protein